MKQENSYYDNHIEEDLLAGKLIREAGTEKAPENLTDLIMSQIDLSKSKIIEYKPVISKKVWMLIGIVLSSLILLVLLAPPSDTHDNTAMNSLSGSVSKAVNYLPLSIPVEIITAPVAVIFGGVFLLALFIILDLKMRNIFRRKEIKNC